jgi:hypothetical protein
MRNALIVLLLTLGSVAMAQLREVSLQDKVSNSSLIVEGRVTAKQSFWNQSHTSIYTVNEIEVYKVFKGQLASKNNGNAAMVQTVKLVTLGGVVGLEAEVVKPSLQLKKDDIGTFTLINSSVQIQGESMLLEPYAGKQGFYRYDRLTGKAAAPFQVYQDLRNAFYPSLAQLTTQPVQIIQPFDLEDILYEVDPNRVITNFTPTTVTAGTGSTITINGSGFGATAGTVQFANADDGGATFISALSTQIVSWNDSQIVVEVPDEAGTGQIQVLNSGSGSHTSAATLTIDYALINVSSDALSSGTFVAYRTQHVDDNGSGGYTFQEHTDFAADSDPSGEFESSIDAWTGHSCINWELGATTTTDVVASDGINIVRFDNGSELPNGVLGRCTSRFSGCFINGGTDIVWYVSELDVVFDDGQNWNYAGAPAITEYDFESVAIHEVGHGHQLGHVINSSYVMHYSLTNGDQNITYSAGEIAGALDVMSVSTSSSVCGESVMTDDPSCAVCTDPDVPTLSGTTSICNGDNTTITITGDLNDATTWEVYSVSCGGTSETSTASSSFTVSPTTTTTYFVRGEGGCVTPGTCGQITVTVNAQEDASFSYSAGSYCVNDTDPTPTITGDAGGTFSSTAGLSLNSTSGQIDVSASTAGTYTVTYTTGGSCPDNQDVSVTINDLDDASFSYSSASYCVSGTDPTPTITGAAGGTFSSTAGLSINSSTGEIDLSASTVGVYNVTYTTAGTCPNSSIISVTINNLDDASFSYPAASYCAADTDPSATITGASGGTFSSTAGLDLNSSTGLIDLSASTAGAYTVTYTTSGACSNSSNETVTVNENPSITTSSTDETCTANDGTATATPSGGSGSFNIQWDAAAGSQTTATATGLTAGTYGVTITDAVNGCQSSTNVTVSDGCGGLATTEIRSQDCGITVSTFNQIFYANNVSGASSYEFRLTEIVSGTVTTIVRPNNKCHLGLMGLFDLNKTYDVDVRYTLGGVTSAYGAVCQISSPTSIPSIRLINQYCGLQLTSFNHSFYAQGVYGASAYEFYLENAANASENYTVSRSNTQMRLSFAGITAVGETYNVQVRATVNGVTGSYGNVCQVHSPATVPSTSLYGKYCGINLSSINSNFYCTTVSGATTYRFEFRDPSSGALITETDRPYRYCSLNHAGLTTPGETYDVRVKAELGGVFGSYTTTCQVTAPGTSLMDLEQEIAISEGSEHKDGDQFEEINVEVFPNPSSGVFHITNAGGATLSLVDLSGKLLMSTSENTVIIDMQAYESGMYILMVQNKEGLLVERKKLVLNR